MRKTKLVVAKDQTRRLAANPESVTITNGGVWCRSKKIGKCDNIINPLQGLSEKPVDGGIGQTKASKPDHNPQIKYIFLFQSILD